MEFQKEELNEILNIFQQESTEIISSMDGKLLILEKEPSNELAMQLFRDAHSLKGSARMLGFNDIQNIAHKIEDIISLVKENKIKFTSKLSDTISESLEFISMLINKTVENKEEFKSPDVNKYIEKLENIAKNNHEEEFIEQEEINESKKLFLQKQEKIEKILLNLLFVISSSRLNENFDNISKLDNEINELKHILECFEDGRIVSAKYKCENLLNAIDKFKISDNKAFSFLEINNTTNALIETIVSFCNEEKIKKINFYEIVDEKLSSLTTEVKKVDEVVDLNNEKMDEILARIPLLELNCSFFDETLEILNKLIYEIKDNLKKEILLNVKEIIFLHKEKKTTIAHDISHGLSEIIEDVKNSSIQILNEAKSKSDVIKTMANFHQKEHKNLTNNQQNEVSQKDILNTITNTEIKTLRVDSIKLDNLVGQIGELIVSKIKTNEQLSLAKKITNELIDWQKNFVKMSYYIKYFDKKYLTNPLEVGLQDNRKIIAYNRQLCMLSEQHNDKITSLIKEMSNLFKQLQESETKLNSTATEIETMVKNMRILPLSTIFQLFPRMVHNIARDKNKKIDLVIEGSDITADKTIIEEMKIPLMHIIRNSIDHGIEDVETRKALGKNPIGKIEIIATYQDNRVIIDIKDDGRGLDIEKIKQKALEKNLLTPDELNAISEDELTNLIFYPGFSTENFVTELSGRGLGLDIVNNKINQLQGRIDIFSQLNQGTVVRVILPATVATKKVFIIQEHKQLWAIETSVIKTIARINIDEIFEKENRSYYIYSNTAIPIYTLSQILGFENSNRHTNKYTLMIIETDNTIFGVIVEKLISDQEIVHKKLAPPLYKVKHISGITTLANGEACLILNVGDIINTITSKKIRSKLITKNGIIKNQDNSKYKVLIVDDSHTTRILQKNILSNQGYNVSTATNPINALERLKQINYDLIISDIQMPEMNGFEFITELRKMQIYEKTPVIVVSSEPKENYVKEIEKTKIITYMQKNLFNQDELVKIIEKYLNY